MVPGWHPEATRLFDLRLIASASGQPASLTAYLITRSNSFTQILLSSSSTSYFVFHILLVAVVDVPRKLRHVRLGTALMFGQCLQCACKQRVDHVTGKQLFTIC